MKYSGARTNCIAFPMGGIGAGSVSLSGKGELIDFEIANRPNKGSVLEYTHLAVKAEKAGKVVDAKILHADLPPPYMGTAKGIYYGFGYGPDRKTLAGLPHFSGVDFEAEFPFACLSFPEAEFPVAVKLHAFSPFIPLNADDSSLPVACFEVEFINRSQEEYELTSVFAMSNHFCGEAAFIKAGPGRIEFGSSEFPEDSTKFGNLTLTTDAERTSFQHTWYRGAWFDGLTKYWHDLTTPGPFVDRNRPEGGQSDGNSNTAVLAAHVTVKPGESRKVRWIMSWYFPNFEKYWNPPAGEKPAQWRNYYASLFDSSGAVADYVQKNWQRLYGESRRFTDAVSRVTLPDYAVDAVTANLSVLKSPTCWRLEDGSFYAFEGCHSQEGSCEGSCTHVWNYAYALPFLFPGLERSMRDLDFTHNQNAAGGMTFRLLLPLGQDNNFRPCVDGQMGGVIKTYREWKISGDTEWLKSHWNSLKANLAYAWHPDNYDRWDPEKSGVITGRQHHTLDMELFGPGSWLTGFYLAALKAGMEIARELGDDAAHAEFSAIFERGRKWVKENLFNGEYFFQKIDLKDASILAPFAAKDPDVMKYWDEEAGELKYQYGSGSIIDQVLAQWHCNLVGLGEVFDREQVRSALRALYKYNFKSMRGHANFCRIYALNDEAGMVICEWPHQEGRPVIGVPYSTETMHGFEYQAAIHMLQEGMVEEGMAVIKSVRDRYDGERRNPFNEFECGSNYARSMASYAILNAASGFQYDMSRGSVGFAPYVPERPFVGFWSLDCGWGNIRFEAAAVRLSVEYGSIELKEIALPPETAQGVGRVEADGSEVAFTRDGGRIVFARPVKIAGELLLA